MSKSYSLKESLWAEDRAVKCSNVMCERMLVKNRPFFWDAIEDKDYCDSCGKCLRYARKKAEERGEPIETAEIN